jgi:hypothetical protein
VKKLAPALCAALAVSMLGACATGYDGPHHGGAYYSDAYYDDSYGAYYDGYWGGDGSFYYRDTADHPYVRDDAKHFRRDNGGTGFHHVKAHRPPDTDKKDGDHGDHHTDH